MGCNLVLYSLVFCYFFFESKANRFPSLQRAQYCFFLKGSPLPYDNKGASTPTDIVFSPSSIVLIFTISNLEPYEEITHSYRSLGMFINNYCLCCTESQNFSIWVGNDTQIEFIFHSHHQIFKSIFPLPTKKT